jgi:putative oxidoreductase
VGLIFFTQGILKYADPTWGVIRLAKIGFPFPDFTAHFVGSFELICGLLLTIGLLTRFAALPLLIINLVAIATTKIPELFRPELGFWFLMSDARTDFAMLMGIVFLLIVGAGAFSVDAQINRDLSTSSPRWMQENNNNHCWPLRSTFDSEL